ncbi:hypothetical protein [Liberiplasma polymorphum]|uniref:hypothetical protein n=1 Tax=Liberiplasma polymorphum TaxID=3374570 RepID=UPI003773A71D
MKTRIFKLFKGINHTVKKPLHKDLLDASILFIVFLSTVLFISLVLSITTVYFSDDSFIERVFFYFKEPLITLLIGFVILLNETKKMNAVNNQNARIAYSLYIGLFIIFIFLIIDIKRLGLF